MIITIYGFGSFFNGSRSFNDIDILIIHASISYDSCLEAIEIKSEILSRIKHADVTILSDSEERHVNFIEKSAAFLLGSYSGLPKKIITRDLIIKIDTFIIG